MPVSAPNLSGIEARDLRRVFGQQLGQTVITVIDRQAAMLHDCVQEIENLRVRVAQLENEQVKTEEAYRTIWSKVKDN